MGGGVLLLGGRCQYPITCHGYPDLPMRKTLRVVGLLTLMIFFQAKKFTACKIKDEKRGENFSFFDGVQSTEVYPSI